MSLSNLSMDKDNQVGHPTVYPVKVPVHAKDYDYREHRNFAIDPRFKSNDIHDRGFVIEPRF